MPPVCRHTKRYQDIEELLNAGIDAVSYTHLKKSAVIYIINKFVVNGNN